ncbi:glycosyltransferase family 4 protein [Vibrio alginolyticus]|uniref:glycosyltransferase family 4 protein n=1 Tax=Vibrio alginolyticus TaxID=663 RepID=UPI00130339B8|nr:glycosyltransferase family 4 protein [Vibrio alginolyticus]
MNKNILLLSNAYYPSIGGIENSLRHLAEEAKKSGDTPTIIVSDIAIAQGSSNQFFDTIEGVEVKRYPLAPKSNWMRVFNIFLSSYEHYKLLKQERLKLGNRDTVVIARFHYSAYLAYLAGFKSVKYVVPSVYKNQLKVEPNSSLAQHMKRKIRLFIHNFAQIKALKYSENYVFSETMKKQCIELSGDENKPYIITKPGVDAKRFHPVEPEEKKRLRQELGLPEDKPIVLFVGRFVAAKGVSVLIDAFAQIKSDAVLVLVGEGTEHQTYINKIESSNLQSKVKLFPPTRDVEKFYQSADLFAMTSNYEPLGQTILEAVASGLEIVAFRPSNIVDTAIEELNINDLVSYAEEYDPASLSNTLDVSLKQIANNNRKNTTPRFPWESLYRELIEDGVE